MKGTIALQLEGNCRQLGEMGWPEVLQKKERYSSPQGQSDSLSHSQELLVWLPSTSGLSALADHSGQTG